MHNLHLRSGELMLYFLEDSVYINYLEFFCTNRFVSSSWFNYLFNVFIHLINQMWVYGFTDIYFMHWRRNGNPLQCSCLENPRDGGAWWAAIYGVAQSWTWLKQLSSSSHDRSFFINFNLFFNFLLHCVFVALRGLSLVEESGGPLSGCTALASHFGCFLVAQHRL